MTRRTSFCSGVFRNIYQTNRQDTKNSNQQPFFFFGGGGGVDLASVDGHQHSEDVTPTPIAASRVRVAGGRFPTGRHGTVVVLVAAVVPIQGPRILLHTTP